MDGQRVREMAAAVLVALLPVPAAGGEASTSEPDAIAGDVSGAVAGAEANGDDAGEGDGGEGDPQPLPAAEAVTAAPATGPPGEGGAVTVVEADPEAGDAEEPEPAITVAVGVSTAVGSGTWIRSSCPNRFASDPYIDDIDAALADQCVGNRTAYVGQAYTLDASYGFDLLDRRFVAGARWVFDVEFTTPDRVPDRRFDSTDPYLYLRVPELWVEPFTELKVNASVGAFLPGSYTSLEVTQRLLALQAGAGIERRVGPVDLSYGLTIRKSFNNSPFALRRGTARASDPLPNRGEGVFIPAGAANTEWELIHVLSAVVEILEELRAGYSLAIWNRIGYAVHDAEHQAANAHVGPQSQGDVFWPQWFVTYALTDALDAWIESPVAISIGLRAEAVHPTQEANNRGFIPPLVFNAFTADLAARQYGSLSFNVTASWKGP